MLLIYSSLPLSLSPCFRLHLLPSLYKHILSHLSLTRISPSLPTVDHPHIKQNSQTLETCISFYFNHTKRFLCALSVSLSSPSRSISRQYAWKSSSLLSLPLFRRSRRHLARWAPFPSTRDTRGRARQSLFSFLPPLIYIHYSTLTTINPLYFFPSTT